MRFGLLVGFAFAIEQLRQPLQRNLLPLFQLRWVDAQFRSQLIDGLFFFQQLFDRFCLERRTIVFALSSSGLYFWPFDCLDFGVHYKDCNVKSN